MNSEEHGHGLDHELRRLTTVLGALPGRMASELSWLKSQLSLATKQDLNVLEERLSMKISELKVQFPAFVAQLSKISAEQQKRFDELSAAFEELKKQLADAELDPETTQAIDEFKTLLQQFDDTIPDTTP